MMRSETQGFVSGFFTRFLPFSSSIKTILVLFVITLVCLPYADLDVAITSPWIVLRRILMGAITPSYPSAMELLNALVLTVQFAVVGVMAAVVVGLLLARFYRWQVVRWFCALIRAVHELFWALLLIALVGVSPLAGLLAIAIPYSGIFAKVFYEMLLQADSTPGLVLQGKSGFFSRLIYSKLAQMAPRMSRYISYRLECALRSSAVLGFVGLPTLGYYLETSIKEGRYSEVWLLMYLLLVLIGTKRWWFSRRSWLLLTVLAFVSFPFSAGVLLQDVGQFISEDLMPAPLRMDNVTLESWWLFLSWFDHLWQTEIFPGVVNTFVLTMLSLIATAGFVLLMLPGQSVLFAPKYTWLLGRAVVLLVRSLPEVILAFIVMLIIGPSMLPAIVALAIHNGGVISYLMRHQMDGLTLRQDHATGLLLYCYEVMPRISTQFMSFWLYRWEVIMRETAILGLLGVPTLGFYIDSAFEDIRYDRAFILILAAAVLNIGIETISGRLQRLLNSTAS
ncbi:MAG: hypothetical protein COA99_07785 [Moraxellaceae bacterium]|nr:MAG: hypothetical protein COA99_07785 [Moraxellaceae bacterium]